MAFPLCIVGCGSLSKRMHGPSYRRYAEQHPEVVLAACCDLDAARAEAYRQTFGFARAYTDFREMLAAERPAAVCLIAPVEATCALGGAILELGYPLLLEKPPGLDGDECRRLIAAAAKTSVPNQVAFNRRHCPLVAELKTRLEAFSPEAIHDIRYDFLRIGRKDPDFSTTAIHGIDTVRFLAGSDYRRVRFTYREFPELGPGVANLFLEAEFVSGATAHLNFCPVSGLLVERATINLLDHTFLLHIPIWNAHDAPGRLVHLHRGQTVADLAGGEGESEAVLGGFYGENASFLDDLRAGRHPRDDLASGLQSVEIAACIRQRLPEIRF